MPLLLLLTLSAVVIADAAVLDARRRTVAAAVAADLGVGTSGVPSRVVAVRTAVARAPLPTDLRVARLGIASPLVSLGKTRRGTLEVPADYGRAGWYTGSARPGDAGPTVLVGHVDSKDGPGIFYRLRDVQRGDVVQVVRADRSVASFRVTRTLQVSKARFPTRQVYGSTGTAGLRLITCGGQFDRASGHYLSNTIVFASYVGATRPPAAPRRAARPFLVRGSAPVRPLPVVRPRPVTPAPLRELLRHRAR